MANTGQPWEIPYQSLAEPPNGPLGQQEQAEKVASHLGRAYPCSSTTRPTAVPGLIIHESDTGLMYIADSGGAWDAIAFGDDTGWLDAIEAGCTASANMSLVSGNIKRKNGVVSLYCTLTTTAGFSSGDIGNLNVMQVPAAFRPGLAIVGGLRGGATGADMTFNLTNTGLVVIANTGGVFAAGATFNVAGTYLL